MRLKIAPLSVNSAYKGRKFKTPAYKAFEKEAMLLMRPIKMPKPPFCVKYEFGYSSKLADIDNGIKVFQDLAATKYGFNDRDIYELHAKKVIVPKGEEYIDFEITTI